PGGWLFVETAGGVHSPGPSGLKTQADLYIALRAPALLVGDPRLGGISQTISAFESLRLRGYDVEAVLLLPPGPAGHDIDNHRFLADYFANHYGIPVRSLSDPPPGRDGEDAQRDEAAMRAYYEGDNRRDVARRVLEALRAGHRKRLSDLDGLAARASRHIWYPFTQQSLVGPGDIMTIDSAHGDYFQTLVPPPPPPPNPARDMLDTETGIGSGSSSSSSKQLLQASFDGSASWWTQGLGHSNPALTLAAAHAAGRYGHVMFASAIHQPAMALAESLLDAMQNPRLRRVFYSDNGSTGAEVAVKMGLRAARLRYGWDARQELHILGLRGAYHGDTIGAMDCADPGVYNEKMEWYEGRGHWLEYPTVLCRDGRWTVAVPADADADADAAKDAHGALRGPEGEEEEGLGRLEPRAYGSLNDVFDLEAREAAGEHAPYEEYITRTLERLRSRGRKFGALMLEPVVLGAGGMQLVDPLFQRTLVNTVRKSPHLFGTTTPDAPPNPPSNSNSISININPNNDWTGLPVIFDEVFTGLYRLGRRTSASFLGLHPDISVHAKLLTGGLLPLCATLASEAIFGAFLGPDKTDALLHGHSYTAHPIGCRVALESLRQMRRMEDHGAWDWARAQGWAASRPLSSSSKQQQQQQQQQQDGHGVVVDNNNNNNNNNNNGWSTWPRRFVEHLSRQTDHVTGVWALGSVLAIHLADPAGRPGYGSNAAAALRDELAAGRPDGGAGPWNVHSRVLGNVLYLMTSQVTSEETVGRLCELLVEGIDRAGAAGKRN
ncbi:hypothetical protein E4U41_001502, partial [Claviceps citrina]